MAWETHWRHSFTLKVVHSHTIHSWGADCIEKRDFGGQGRHWTTFSFKLSYYTHTSNASGFSVAICACESLICHLNTGKQTWSLPWSPTAVWKESIYRVHHTKDNTRLHQCENDTFWRCCLRVSSRRSTFHFHPWAFPWISNHMKLCSVQPLVI